jgi:hypothetical protein
MISKPVVLGLLAAGSITAAAGGAYVAVRQNTADGATPAGAVVAAPAPGAAPDTLPSGSEPVAETEALVSPVATGARPPIDIERARPESARVTKLPASRTTRPVERRPSSAERRRPAAGGQAPSRTPATEPPTASAEAEPLPAGAPSESVPPEPVRLPEPPPAPEPRFVELVVPVASVIGLQVETSLTTERASVEDRVEAHVTRDVVTGTRVAIPAGARVIGSVTLVERGGKIKERARLGVRFHTLVFADGTEVPIRTEAVYREGESPGRESSAKIGGAAVGGAILGAILGGGKGAVLGSATGAAGGTAAVMAGGRNAATLPAGTVLTVRLEEPVTVDVEKR